MSWDVFIAASDSPPPPIEKLPQNWQGNNLGNRDQLKGIISKIFPDTEWNDSDPKYGHLRQDGYSFEFHITEKQNIRNLSISVRGGGDALTGLKKLANATGWYMIDCSENEWFHHQEHLGESWSKFQTYRDHITKISNEGKRKK